MNKVQIALLSAFAAVCAATTVAVVQLNGEQAAPITGDFRNAAVAEVHDTQGYVLLRGTFAPVESDDEGEVERLATMTPAAPEVKASGEAEVEYETNAPSEQEVELTLTGVTAGAEINFVIDGQRVATAKADQRGRVSIEVAVKAGGIAQ
jgi:hypothetical protein